MQSRNWLNTYGGDAVLRLMLFYLGLAPTGAAWSIDALLRRYRAGAQLPDARDPAVGALAERRCEPERAYNSGDRRLTRRPCCMRLAI